jgi:signal transduction histidine kinase
MRILVLILLLSIQGFSQFKITHYNTKNGLPHDLTYQLIEDRQGYVWFGTDNGLVKYDGRNFTNFDHLKGLNSNFVIDVLELKNHKKVIATWGGGLHFVDDNKRNAKLPKEYSSEKLNRVIEIGNNFFASDSKNTFVHFTESEKNIKRGQFHFFYNKNIIDTISGNHNNKVLMFQMKRVNNQVFFFSNASNNQIKGVFTLTHKLKPIEKFPFLKPYFIKDLLFDNKKYRALTQNEIIEFSEDRIISIKSLGLDNFRALNFWENITYLAILVENNFTKTQKIILFNKESKIQTEVLASNFNNAPISDVLLPSISKSIFVSTYGSGVYKLTPEISDFKNILFKGENIFDYQKDDDYNYFLGVNNVFILNKSFKTQSKIYKKDCFKIVDVYKDTVHIKKIGEKNEVVNFRNKILKFDYIDARNQIRFENNDKLDIGDNIVTVKRDGENHTISFDKISLFKLQLKIVKVIFFKNQYWFATNQGIYVFDSKTLFFLKKYRTEEGLSSINLTDITTHDGKVWLTSTTDLMSIESNDEVKVFSYHQNFDDYINSFHVDEQGKIWLATQKGFAIFRNNNFYRYTYKNGYQSSFTDKIFKVNDEILLLGNEGVTRINQETNLLQNKPSFRIQCNYRFNGKPFRITSKDSLQLTPEVLDYYDSEFLIEYKLNSNKWQKFQDQSIRFDDFENGNYTIQFRARYYNSDYVYSEKILVEKKSLWYLRWYSIALGFVFVGVLFYVFINWRLEKLRKRNLVLQRTLLENQELQEKIEQMRHNVAQDFHDELGNKIAGITLMSDRLMYDKNVEGTESFSVVKRINKDSQDLYHGIRDFIWAIDAKNDSLEELIVALTDFGEDLFQNSGIAFIVQNSIEDKTIKLPLYWNRQLLLLFKEAMTNALKYSQAKKVTLYFDLDAELLKISLNDDGIGFYQESLKRKNGLLNMQNRAKKISGKLIIENQQGTQVTFKGQL